MKRFLPDCPVLGQKARHNWSTMFQRSHSVIPRHRTVWYSSRGPIWGRWVLTIALVATWHLSVPVLTCRSEVHPPPQPKPLKVRDIWQVASKKSATWQHCIINGPDLGPLPGEEKGEFSEVPPPSSPSLPASIYHPLSLESYAKSAIYLLHIKCMPASLHFKLSSEKKEQQEKWRKDNH